MTGLLERSFLAAVVIIAVVIVRAVLLHKLPKVTFWMMWLVVVLRLLVPFSVPVFDAPDGGLAERMAFFGKGTRDIPAGDGGKDAGSIPWGDDGKNAGNNPDGNDGKNAGNNPDGNESKNAGNNPDGNESKNAGNIPDGNESKNAENNSEGNDGKNVGNIPDRNDDRNTENNWDHSGTQQQTIRNTTTMDLPNGHSSTQTAEERTGQAWPGIMGNGQNKIPYNAIFHGIWLVGMLSVFLFFTISHLRAKKFYSTALPVDHPLPEIGFFRRKVTVKVSDQIFAPVTYGVLSPVILLPKNTDWKNMEQLCMVLKHEAVHIRRFDIFYKWLLVAAAALHWFNPLVWVMYILANRDIELSCDEAVLRCLTGCGKKDYALALLSYEEKRMFSPTVSGFGGNAVRERMEAIMKTNKKSVVGMAMAVILVAGTTTVFAGAKDGKKALTDTQNPENKIEGLQNSDGENKNDLTPGSQNARGEDNNKTPDPQGGNGQDSDNPQQGGKDEKNTPSTVKQYICEPAYYTPEEFAEAVKEEREQIRKEVAEGSITQDGADELIADLEQRYNEVKNGRQIEKPSPVYYADHTPVVGSDGCQLYAKASDIERMNRELREAAQWLENASSIEEWDDVVEEGILKEGLFFGNPDDFVLPETDVSWYSYEEYREYVEQQKEEYRSLKGEWGFNLTDGWFEWDEEKIEAACRLLDENLEFIKNGGKISKPDADGGVLMSGSSKFDFESASEEKWMMDDAKWAMSMEEAKEKGYDVRMAEKMSAEGGRFDGAFLKAYDAFGVAVDEKTGCYLYQGKKVAGFWDAGVVMADGAALEENGIYLKGVREDGKLVRIVEITKEEFCELSGLTLS